MSKVVFYDLHSSGHHLEYVQHLLRFLPLSLNCVFILQEIMLSKLDTHDQVTFLANPFDESQTSRIEEIQWLSTFMLKNGCRKVFFLNLDPYISNLRVLDRLHISISGILFHPYHRISLNFEMGLYGLIKNIGKRLRGVYHLKKLQNLTIKPNIFLLDDSLGAIRLARKSGLDILFLPDPISLSQKVVTKGAQEVKTALLFGSIIPRKNIDGLIRETADNDYSDWLFKVVGKGNAEYIEKLRENINPSLQNVNIENRFVSIHEMETLFSEATAIIMVYKNFYGSSGVLGQAAKYNKPVIASKSGLIAELIQMYNLGLLIDVNYKGLHQALLTVEETLSNSKSELFLMKKTPKEFATTIFQIYQ